jgi:putative tryptophan/tyrosine transport system substrate-binding protein
MGRRMDKKVLYLISILFFAGSFFISSLPLRLAFSSEEQVVVALRSKTIKPYNDALSGFEEELAKNGYKPSQRSYDLDEAKGKEQQLVKEIRDLKPMLIFAAGTEAALFAKEKLKDFPVVFSMVLDPVKSGIIESASSPGDSLSGVSLDISPELQFRKLKELLPKLSRVGVIYNAKEKAWIKEIEAVARALGLVIVAKPVDSESDVPVKLEEIAKEADCLWAQVDPMIYNSQSSQYILLTLVRNKIPLMAFSSQYVKAGALLALECDYVDIGRQAAQIAIRVLKGGAFGSVALTFPAKAKLIVNKKIAQLLGINIPQKILEEASEVY